MIENRGLFMENNIIEESGLKFQFPKNDTVIKFDDTKFYRDYFNKLPEAKGVDFISVDKNKIAFIEVNDYISQKQIRQLIIYEEKLAMKMEEEHFLL